MIAQFAQMFPSDSSYLAMIETLALVAEVAIVVILLIDLKLGI